MGRREKAYDPSVFIGTNHMPMVFLHQNSSARLLVTYRSVSISLRVLAALSHARPGKFAERTKKRRGNRALPVARGKLYTPAGYLLTVNTTAALRATCTHCGQMDAKSPLLLQFSSRTEISAVAAID